MSDVFLITISVQLCRSVHVASPSVPCSREGQQTWHAATMSVQKLSAVVGEVLDTPLVLESLGLCLPECEWKVILYRQSNYTDTITSFVGHNWVQVSPSNPYRSGELYNYYMLLYVAVAASCKPLLSFAFNIMPRGAFPRLTSGHAPRAGRDETCSLPSSVGWQPHAPELALHRWTRDHTDECSSSETNYTQSFLNAFNSGQVQAL